MSPQRRLKLVDPQPSTPTTTAASQFTREIVTPPGSPWRQRQAADLDARLGAPVASDGLIVRLARQEPWRLGQIGKFTAVYTRGGPGAPKTSPGDTNAGGDWALEALDNPRVRAFIALGVTLVSVVLVTLASSAALNRRGDIAGDLAAIDAELTPLEHRARHVAQLDRQAASLDGVGGQSRSVAKVLADLDWVAAHRRPDVALANLHWLKGVTAVETASPDTPFSAADRTVQRATHPLRPGIWLWGVASRGDVR